MTIVILEAGLRVGGALYGASQERRNRLAMKDRGVFRILCVGESTTAYYRVGTPYPAFLEDRLNQASLGVRFSVINKGVVGAGTSDIVADLEKNLEIYKPDMVIAMMGINDCGFFSYKLRPSSRIESFLSHFRTYNLLKLIFASCVQRIEAMKLAKTSSGEVLQRQRILAASKELRAQRDEVIVKSWLPETPVPSREEDPEVIEGLRYKEQGQYALAEACFKRVLSRNPGHSVVWLKLGWLYQERGDFPQAEASFKEAIESSPGEANAYYGLAVSSREQGKSKFLQAEASFEKAIELDPGNGEYWFMRAFYHRDQSHDHRLAEECFKKAGDLMADKYLPYRELGRTYIEQGKLEEAEALFEEFQNKYPDNDRIQQDFIQLLERKGQGGKAVEAAQGCFWDVTAKNYIKMEEILRKKKIRFVCVSYPMRDSAPLEAIFKGKRGILFVDNEEPFKVAVSRNGYGTYFIDKMFDDFGHCTEKGNQLLAENIAQILLREAFR